MKVSETVAISLTKAEMEAIDALLQDAILKNPASAAGSALAKIMDHVVAAEPESIKENAKKVAPFKNMMGTLDGTRLEPKGQMNPDVQFTC